MYVKFKFIRMNLFVEMYLKLAFIFNNGTLNFQAGLDSEVTWPVLNLDCDSHLLHLDVAWMAVALIVVLLFFYSAW